MGRSNSHERENAELLRSIWRRLSPPSTTAVVWEDDYPYADPLSWPSFLETPEGPLKFEARWAIAPDKDSHFEEHEYTSEYAQRGVEVDFEMDEVDWDASDQHPYRLMLRRPGESYPDEDHLPLEVEAIRAMSDEQVSEELARVLRAMRKPGLHKSVFHVFKGNDWGILNNGGEGLEAMLRYCCLLENQAYLGREYFLRLSRQKAPQGAAWAAWSSASSGAMGLVGYLNDDFHGYEDPSDRPWVERLQEPWPNPLQLQVSYMPRFSGPHRNSVNVVERLLDAHVFIALDYPRL